MVHQVLVDPVPEARATAAMNSGNSGYGLPLCKKEGRRRDMEGTERTLLNLQNTNLGAAFCVLRIRRFRRSPTNGAIYDVLRQN